MDPVLLAAVVGGITTVVVPILNKFLGRDPRVDLSKDLEILQKLNPNSVGYQAFEKHVDLGLKGFAKNAWIKNEYRKIYWRSIVAVAQLVVLYLINTWKASNPDANWITYLQYACLTLLSLTVTTIAIHVGTITASEFDLLKLELNIRRLEAKASRLDKLDARVNKHSENRLNKYYTSKTASQEHAKIYNTALYWGLLGNTKSECLKSLKLWPTQFETDIKAVCEEVFTYLDTWKKSNEMPNFKTTE